MPTTYRSAARGWERGRRRLSRESGNSWRESSVTTIFRTSENLVCFWAIILLLCDLIFVIAYILICKLNTTCSYLFATLFIFVSQRLLAKKIFLKHTVKFVVIRYHTNHDIYIITTNHSMYHTNHDIYIITTNRSMYHTNHVHYIYIYI